MLVPLTIIILTMHKALQIHRCFSHSEYPMISNIQIFFLCCVIFHKLKQIKIFRVCKYLLPSLTCLQNSERFLRTFATGAACRQRILTCSFPNLGLAFVPVLISVFRNMLCFWSSNFEYPSVLLFFSYTAN